MALGTSAGATPSGLRVNAFQADGEALPDARLEPLASGVQEVDVRGALPCHRAVGELAQHVASGRRSGRYGDAHAAGANAVPTAPAAAA